MIGENDRELSDVELVIRATDNDGASMKMYQRVTVIDRDCKYDDYRVRLNLRDQETGAYLSAEEDG
ncbi:hypothetical protein, partial [Klebsiella pneumoniae]|uniref:hypothetical protein n=1 Tax=Klebsiella pneumoniae TaxID=573 RepID=UPI0025A12723